MWRRPFLGLIYVLATLATLPALAFERPFPAGIQRGALSVASYPEITLNGKPHRLAPGARIWNQENLIQLPASLRGNELPVNYTEDAQGDIDRVWILTDEEAKAPLPKQPNSQSR